MTAIPAIAPSKIGNPSRRRFAIPSGAASVRTWPDRPEPTILQSMHGSEGRIVPSPR